MNKESKLFKHFLGFRFALFVFLLSLITSSLTFAQQQGGGGGDATAAAGSGGTATDKHIVGLSLGQTFLLSSWGDEFNNALSYNLFYNYEASPVFGLLFNMGISPHAAQVNPDKDDLTILSFEPDLKVNFFYFDKIVLYGFVGFGIYPISETLSGAEGSVVTFGMNAGVGVDLRIADQFVFGTGMVFKSIFTQTDTGNTAKSTRFPSGLEMGGELMRLYVQVGYIF